jgi:hypothetical protein
VPKHIRRRCGGPTIFRLVSRQRVPIGPAGNQRTNRRPQGSTIDECPMPSVKGSDPSGSDSKLWPSVGTGVLHPVGSNRRPAVAPDPAPRTKLWEPGRGVCPARMPDAWVVVWSPPHPPVWTSDPRPLILRKSALFGAEFLRIFGPCGATSRGGGGAPPTTLILLRNQRRRLGCCAPPARAGSSGVRGVHRGRPGPACLPKSAKKFVFFGSC